MGMNLWYAGVFELPDPRADESEAISAAFRTCLPTAPQSLLDEFFGRMIPHINKAVEDAHVGTNLPANVLNSVDAPEVNEALAPRTPDNPFTMTVLIVPATLLVGVTTIALAWHML